MVDEEIKAEALVLVHLSLFLKHLNYTLARLGSYRNPDSGKIPAGHTLCETTVSLKGALARRWRKLMIAAK